MLMSGTLWTEMSGRTWWKVDELDFVEVSIYWPSGSADSSSSSERSSLLRTSIFALFKKNYMLFMNDQCLWLVLKSVSERVV